MKHFNHINAISHIPFIDDYYVFNLSNQMYTILLYIIAQHRYNKGGMKLSGVKKRVGIRFAGQHLNTL